MRLYSGIVVDPNTPQIDRAAWSITDMVATEIAEEDEIQLSLQI